MNKVHYNNEDGIGIDGNNNHITNNMVYNSGWNGIDIVASSFNNTIEDNYSFNNFLRIFTMNKYYIRIFYKIFQ